MAEMLEPELCVIGCGPGAIAVATGAAALGARVLLVRHGPSSLVLRLQALLAAAASAQAVRSAGRFGVTTGGIGVDFGKLRDHVRHVAAAVAPNEAPERLAGLGIRVIDGVARFISANAMTVGENFEIRPKHVVIATESTAIVPAIDGLDGEVLTPESLFDLDECPESLAVIGASPLGLELAQAFHQFGAKVTVIDPDRPLPDEDAECSAILLRRFQEQGVVLLHARPVRVARSDGRVELALERNGGGMETIHVSHVLATGRHPALGDLNLAAGGIAADGSGITVDDHLRSSNPKVFAIGEAVGSPSVAAANRQAEIVVRNLLLNGKSAFNADAVPRVIFTDPGFAHVGLDEKRARALHRTIRVHRSPFLQNDRAQAERDTAGHIKIVTTQDGTIVGVTIVGRGAADQIAGWGMAVEAGLGVHDLSGWIPPYATRAEAGKQALTGLPEAGLTRPAPTRIISLLRRRG